MGKSCENRSLFGNILCLKCVLDICMELNGQLAMECYSSGLRSGLGSS